MSCVSLLFCGFHGGIHGTADRVCDWAREIQPRAFLSLWKVSSSVELQRWSVEACNVCHHVFILSKHNSLPPVWPQGLFPHSSLVFRLTYMSEPPPPPPCSSPGCHMAEDYRKPHFSTPKTSDCSQIQRNITIYRDGSNTERRPRKSCYWWAHRVCVSVFQSFYFTYVCSYPTSQPTLIITAPVNSLQFVFIAGL